MAIQVVGNQATEKGRPVDPGTKYHREAVAAARSRSASAAIPRVGQPEATVFAAIALDFAGAHKYISKDESKRKAMFKEMAEPLRHQNTVWPAGSWFGRYLDGDLEVLVLDPEEFTNNWRKAPQPRKAG